MRDVKAIEYYWFAKACAEKAASRTDNASEWERLAKSWEFLAQVHNTMQPFSTETPRADQDEDQSIGIGHPA